jgi:2-haloacid dehalogenase
MPLKPTIIFDLGGVLIDWDPRYLYRKIFPEQDQMEFFLEHICSPSWNAQMDRGYPFQDAVAELSREHPQYSGEIRAFYDRWEEMISGPFPGTVGILEEVRAAGYPLAALSNWSGETLPRVAHQFEFLEWFDPLVVSGDVKMVKPEAEIFHFLLGELQRQPEDCLFIDDSIANIQTARDLGFQTVHFSSADLLRAHLESLGILKNGSG